MAVLNIGSINIDNVYRVPNFATPGETLLVKNYSRGLGGKGANQSIALARAGAEVRHAGAIGPDSHWVVDAMKQAGVDTKAILTLDIPTGHAVIQVTDSGENSILVCPGANTALTREQIDRAVSAMPQGAWLLFQNETNLTPFIAEAGQRQGLRIAYSAAPFIAETARIVLPFVRLLVVNEPEAAALAALLQTDISRIPVPELVITSGRNGARYIARTADPAHDIDISIPAFAVDAIDTTGAGDTFLGYFLAAFDAGGDAETALTRASAAAAIQVSRPGAADAIPDIVEVDVFLARNHAHD